MPDPTPLSIPPLPTEDTAVHPRAAPQAPAADACAVCHSPLEPSARYCLRCGARRAGARLEFLDVLDDPARPRPAAAAPPPAAPAPPARLDALRGWPFGLTAVVLLALLIGLLAGHWISDRGHDDQAGTQVIRVEGGAAAPAAAAASTATPAATAAPTDTTKQTEDAAKGDAATTAPKKITRESEQKALDDTSGDQNLAPADDDPSGANFDEIK